MNKEQIFEHVISLSQEVKDKFNDNTKVSFYGIPMKIGDIEKFSTVEGIKRQIDEFPPDVDKGIVYYINNNLQMLQDVIER